MTDTPYEQTPHGALSRLFDNVTVMCHTCQTQMRYMGEWPEAMNGHTHQTLRWNCINCRIPHESYHRGLPIYTCIVLDGPILELGRRLAEENK